MTATPRLALPFISAGQAQKELTHNEALQRLDVLVAAAVEDLPGDVPPTSPVVGSCFIVGPDGAGDWAGRSGQLAAWTEGGWRFLAPTEGMTAFVRSAGVIATWRSSGWEVGVVRCSSIVREGRPVLGAPAAAIAPPTGGSVIDQQARTALSAVLAALRGHGLVET